MIKMIPTFARVTLLWLLMLVSVAVYAESITPMRKEARITQNGQLAISSRFKVELPEQLQSAIKQGVALDFVLTYQLEQPTFASYRAKFNQLLSNEHIVNYRLSFHPITNRYRVSVGTFSTEYNRLDTALRAIGGIANWAVLHQGALSDTPPKDVKAQIRLNLSTQKLPKPFQINALTSSNWKLDSGWIDLNIEE